MSLGAIAFPRAPPGAVPSLVAIYITEIFLMNITDTSNHDSAELHMKYSSSPYVKYIHLVTYLVYYFTVVISTSVHKALYLKLQIFYFKRLNLLWLFHEHKKFTHL